MERASGILLHISSLPSNYGIGTLGKAAYAFADFLCSAGQKYWQVLPLGHTGYGDSPYQVFSMFAGNPYFIDLDLLVEEGLLRDEDVRDIFWGATPRFVDYGAMTDNRLHVLRKAFENAGVELKKEAADFRQKEADWVEDYALFMARSACDGELDKETAFFVFVQFLFFRQWDALRAYLKGKGISLIGDIPIYAAPDSAEVWRYPQYFELDGDGMPLAVSGVPPDYFSADGQLWGNPLYNWQAMKADGYALWRRRLKMAARQFDAVRIDHFRGLESYWRVPRGENTAVNGEWRKGPGMEFVRAMRTAFPDLHLIAEDLGERTESLQAFLKESGLPGMKVLQFAFNSHEESEHLPHTYTPFCVCYTGTHDNTTAQGFFDRLSKEDAQYAKGYLGLHEEEGDAWGLIRGGMSSVAALFIMQMQDCLELPEECRMNTPGTVEGNWRWRVLKEELTGKLADQIRLYTRMYGR